MHCLRIQRRKYKMIFQKLKNDLNKNELIEHILILVKELSQNENLSETSRFYIKEQNYISSPPEISDFVFKITDKEKNFEIFEMECEGKLKNKLYHFNFNKHTDKNKEWSLGYLVSEMGGDNAKLNALNFNKKYNPETKDEFTLSIVFDFNKKNEFRLLLVHENKYLYIDFDENYNIKVESMYLRNNKQQLSWKDTFNCFESFFSSLEKNKNVAINETIVEKILYNKPFNTEEKDILLLNYDLPEKQIEKMNNYFEEISTILKKDTIKNIRKNNLGNI